MIKSGNRRNGCVAFLLRKQAQDIKRRYWERFEPDYLLTLSLKKLPMLFCFNYQRLNYFV